MSLQALTAAAETSPQLQIGVGYLLRSIENIPRPHNEGSLLADFYEHSEKELETRAVAKWQVGEIQPQVAGKVVVIAAPQVNKGALEPGIMAASGPNNAQNQGIPNANPHWPNSGQPWSDCNTKGGSVFW